MTTYIVNNNGSSGAGSLPDAITYANAHPGTTINITYVGTISITSTLILSENTTINSNIGCILENKISFLDSAFEITNNTVTVNDAIFQIGDLVSSHQYIFNVQSGSTLNINTTDFNFEATSGTYGTVIISSGTLNMDSCKTNVGIAPNNTITSLIGLSTGQASVTNCIFNGGSIDFSTTGSIQQAFIDLTIGNCTFNGCTFQNFSMIPNINVFGSLIASGTTLNIISCNFLNNQGAPCIYIADQSCEIDSCTFTNNYCTGNPGTCINSIGNLILKNSTLSGNTGVYGGAVSCYYRTSIGSFSVEIDNCIMENNTSSQDGGAAFLSGFQSLILNNNQISYNKSSNYNSGIYTGNIINIKIFNNTLNDNTATLISGSLEVNGFISSYLINNTIANNTDTGIEIYGDGSGSGNAYVIGCTIYDNYFTGSTQSYGLLASGVTTYVGNTVISYNNNQSVNPDVVCYNGSGYVINSLGSNFISNGTGVETYFNQPSDKYGTSSPLNPYLLPLSNNGGPTLTMLPETTPVISPLINSGNVGTVTTYYIYPQVLNSGVPIDQRGLSRIYQSNVDIGAVQINSVICFKGDTKILTKNIKTGFIEYTPINLIYSDTHKVIDISTGNTSNIDINAITGTVSRFVKIEKGSIKKDTPYDDLYVTSGHNLNINGNVMKAIDVPGRVIVMLPTQKIYTLCTPRGITVCANGLGAFTWRTDKFLSYVNNNNIIWKNNKQEYNNYPQALIPQ